MGHSHKKHLTNCSTDKRMKNIANRKIRRLSILNKDILNHNYYKRLTNSYDICDDYWFGWVPDYVSDFMRIFKINRTKLDLDYNDNMWFRHMRNK